MSRKASWSFYVLFMGATLPLQAFADDYGCKVLLCLANPNGPMAVSECVPPISQLFRDMAKPKPPAFPTCDMAEGPNGKSYAKQGISYYDPCPEGTTALEAGVLAYEGSNQIVEGIGSGEGITSSNVAGSRMGQGLGRKICVGNQTGTSRISRTAGEYIAVNTYSKVVMMDPASSPRIIDVFIEDKLFRRVRW